MPTNDLLTFLAALFASAFTSATLLPGTSEGMLIGLIGMKLVPVVLAVGVATAGNTLGSLVNWAIGRFLDRYRHHPRFPVSEAAMARAQRWYDRFGLWSLLASWVPVIGDPLTVVAGMMRVPFLPFLVIVAFAKCLRYAAIAASALAIL